MVIETIKNFLKEHADPAKPLLLGLSGGPDSIALFYALLELKFNFGIAHINHNWRSESLSEAQELKKLSDKFHIPFHLHSLGKTKLVGNLENACRMERLKFFKKLCDEESYQAVILGHHLDDQAETVLKRLFEGSSIFCLQSLRQVTEIEGLKIFRPFLHLKKKTIKIWLGSKNIAFFQDSTNENTKFMRARFRQNIIPYLNQEFGKDITEPLYRLSLQAKELSDYLEEKFSSFKPLIVRGVFGNYFDFTIIHNPFEMKYMVRFLAKESGVSLSHSSLEKAECLLQTNAANKCLMVQGRKIIFDRKKMFVLSNLPVQEFKSLELDTSREGEFAFGLFNVSINKKKSDSKNSHFSSWQNLFKGSMRLDVSEGKYLLKSVETKERKILSDLWTKHKVPAFLRDCFPVLFNSESIYAEFLTEKKYLSLESLETPYEIRVEYRGLNRVDDEKRIC